MAHTILDSIDATDQHDIADPFSWGHQTFFSDLVHQNASAMIIDASIQDK
ncbi:hypothetical protein HanXRQr2_Chr08g0337181 [Helianthus annuus]|uniref:Uncharacterized protein n=1 Tax=Helianthus annuus TaxID=4232 RepID=A0A9K3IEG7_HELAN|nr:hypothetical protein HanXRQr2_Chr08g0337181 [Helianthus annuus]